MKAKIILIILLVAVIPFTGCRTKPDEIGKDYDTPLLPGENALVKITDPYQIPDFTMAGLDLANLKQAVANSISYMNKPSSKNYYPMQDISHERVLKSLQAFAELLDAGVSGAELNAAIREKFDVYMSVGCDKRGTVLFTGYYTPIFEGSDVRTPRFQYPLYKKPENLIKGPNGEIVGQRLVTGRVVGYPPRSVIENTDMFEGNELVWLSDAFESYIAHVQGSVKLRMPDGNIQTVGYAASNGHDYKSISRRMIEDGIIQKSQLSLSGMIKFFSENPDLISAYTRLNPRFVFFRNQSGNPRGSLNEEVIKLRSIATDKSIFPRASLTFVTTQLPTMSYPGEVVNQIYSGFALDQDTGGAIRAPGRCDIYMGVGDDAGQLAGRVYQEGKLYYLILKQNQM